MQIRNLTQSQKCLRCMHISSGFVSSWDLAMNDIKGCTVTV